MKITAFKFVLLLIVSSISLTFPGLRFFDLQVRGKEVPVRRALLIGISEYNKLNTNRSFRGLPSVRNDVRAMEILLASPSYHFKVKKLLDSEATRDRILEEIENYLIKQARPGDVSLLYFSGHGSRVNNSLGGESDGKDETLVPFDVIRPVKKRTDLKDIRDKEINALLSMAAGKGIMITAIIDSCHSGSIAKGDEELRQLEPAEFDIKEAPKKNQMRSATESGALVYSAARDFQRASGAPYGHHTTLKSLGFQSTDTFGHFTANLLFALYETPADAISAENLFQKVEGRMRAKGIPQRPELDAGAVRKRATLFGEELNYQNPRIPIEPDDEGSFYLLGGLANGLTAGSELTRVSFGDEEKGEPPVRIRVTDVELTKSKFTVISEEGEASLKAGDFYEQVTWGVSTETRLPVWIPSSNYSQAELAKLAEEIRTFAQANRITLVEFPFEGEPTHILFVGGGEGKPEWKINLPSGKVETIEDTPTARSLGTIIGGRKTDQEIRLFVNYPPPKDLKGKLGYGESAEGGPVGLAPDRDSATYRLAGRSRQIGSRTALEYAWVLRPGLDDPVEVRTNPSLSETPSLPLITDWVVLDDAKAADKTLHSLAVRLARISGWLNLSSPPGSSNKFPYRLEIRTSDNQKVDESDALLDGESYRLFLTADPDFLSSNLGGFNLRFHVYVIAIDRNGTTSLLPEDGSDEPVKITPLAPEAEIELTDGWQMVIGGDLGTENYVLLMTNEPLPDKSILFSEGVRTTGSKSVPDPLSTLLYSIVDSENTRTSRGGLSTPDNWFVQKLTRVSKKEE